MTKCGQLLDDFYVIHTETFPDYKSARKREKFLKFSHGRKWLNELKPQSGSASE